MEIAYDTASLSGSASFMQFPRQALYGHGNAGQALVRWIGGNAANIGVEGYEKINI